MKNIQVLKIIFLVFLWPINILSVEMLTPDGQLYIDNSIPDRDNVNIYIVGNGEECILNINSVGIIEYTNCQRLINSKKMKILCTKNKKICKTEKEIYDALKGEIKGEYLRIPGIYEVIAQELNVREQPKKQKNNILGTVKRGERVNIYEFDGKWGRSDKGWISGKYLKYIESINTHNDNDNDHTSKLYGKDDKVDSDENESYTWYGIIGFLIILVLFFQYWKIVLGTVVFIVVGHVILEGSGVDLKNFMIGTIMLFFILGIIGFYFSCSGEECPKCKMCIESYSNKQLLSQHYLHETKTGSPDKRHKYNPLIKKYRYTYKCTNEECGYVFTIDKDNSEEIDQKIQDMDTKEFKSFERLMNKYKKVAVADYDEKIVWLKPGVLFGTKISKKDKKKIEQHDYFKSNKWSFDIMDSSSDG
jgi:hypothetical protein